MEQADIEPQLGASDSLQTCSPNLYQEVMECYAPPSKKKKKKMQQMMVAWRGLRGHHGRKQVAARRQLWGQGDSMSCEGRVDDESRECCQGCSLELPGYT